MELFGNCVYGGADVKAGVSKKTGKDYRFVIARLLDPQTGRLVEAMVDTEAEPQLQGIMNFTPVKVVLGLSESRAGLKLYLKGVCPADA